MTALANKLNYDREVIRVWFCNKRQALKNTVKKFKGGTSSNDTSMSPSSPTQLSPAIKSSSSTNAQQTIVTLTPTPDPSAIAINVATNQTTVDSISSITAQEQSLTITNSQQSENTNATPSSSSTATAANNNNNNGTNGTNDSHVSNGVDEADEKQEKDDSSKVESLISLKSDIHETNNNSNIEKRNGLTNGNHDDSSSKTFDELSTSEQGSMKFLNLSVH